MMRGGTQGVSSFHPSRMKRFHMRLRSVLRRSKILGKRRRPQQIWFSRASEHVPALADTFDREPEDISSKEPNKGSKKKVLGSIGKARRNFEGEGETKLRAGRLRVIVENTASDNDAIKYQWWVSTRVSMI